MTSRSHSTRTRPGSSGNALLPVLMVVLVLATLTATFIRVELSGSSTADSRFDDKRAELLARAGVSEAVAAVRAGATGNVGSIATPAYLGNGVIWVQTTDLGQDRYRMLATALVGKGRAAMDVVLHVLPQQDPLFRATLNSRETLTVNEGVMCDSYDSSVGTYESQAVNFTDGFWHADMGGHVASNQNIVLNANAHVFGDATPGPSYGVEFNTGAYVSGSTDAADEEFSFPPIEVPDIPSQGNLTVPQNGLVSLPAGQYGFDGVDILKGGTLQVTGPAILVVADFAGLRDARLEIDAVNGPVTIHCTSSYTHERGFESVPADGSPMALAFMISAPQDITFPSTTMIRGAYYAPDSSVLFTSNNEVWGAVAARRIEMSSDMEFHFDETLLDHWSEDQGDPRDPVTALAWMTAEVSPAFLRTDRTDPFLLLGVDKASLPSPREAWEF